MAVFTTLSRWNAAFLTWNESPHRSHLLQTGIHHAARSLPPRGLLAKRHVIRSLSEGV